ncbi:hypothetical protein V2A60_008060 [Cordyceps javanica]|uniref:Dyp-type peroxidase n=1 Tax=Cordyceps javanica TaxID=43265 RepID=A0A545UNT7_9HYPO|nr:Dyp-type peroxidase [Cordyceps javanica]TQW02883.1 Dyp-type peroxidase [Cordyceps javanica]
MPWRPWSAAALATRIRPPQHFNMSTQVFCEPLTLCATFLVLTANPGSNSIATIKDGLASLADIIKNISARCPEAHLSCNVGIGSALWDRLQTAAPKPRQLHEFRTFRGSQRTAISTPGDLLLHIRANRRDVVFEFERQLLDALEDSVSVQDETTGFRYFDGRDLLGFVDGTANPTGQYVNDAVIINDETDTGALGGCYIVVQKYMHDMDAWNSLSTSEQERIIGRTKIDNIELEDAAALEQKSHKTLATVEDDGEEHDILRDNMPFGTPGQKSFGTYFIGYSKNLWVIEKMLERMFVGDPPGKHDKILDFSTPVTGTTFYAPPRSVLKRLSR